MKRRQLIIDIALAGLFCTLICIGAFIKIPIFAVPMTLQVFFVLLSALVLTVKSNFFAIFTYIALGIIGLPIFTGGGGLGYVVMPTFGFILGFLIGSVIISITVEKAPIKSFKGYFTVCMIAIAIIYIIGVSYFAFITKTNDSIIAIIQTTVLPFLPKDIICALLASITSIKIKPIINKTM